MGREELMINSFYRLLFELHPEFESMFTHGWEVQRLKFITMLNLIVNGLDHLSALEEPLLELGRKHKHLNIDLEDYEQVNKILVRAIDEGSGKPLSDAEKTAWMNGLTLVSQIMDKESGDHS